jgi:cytoskeletal protein CcmA (bactofilin family)
MLSKTNSMFGKRTDSMNTPQTPASLRTGAGGRSPTSGSSSLAAGTSAAHGTAPASTPENDHDEERGSRLLVGPAVKLRGAEIQDCDTLVVEGRVEATMDSRVIQIAEHGSFAGKVGIDVAEIWGSFDGELTARKQLIVHSTGRVSGHIRYGKIVIEEGGEISGDIKSLSGDARPATVSASKAGDAASGEGGEKTKTFLSKAV